MKCAFQQLADGRWYCPNCGETTKHGHARAPNRNCQPSAERPFRLGDGVSIALAWIGLSIKRYAWLRGRRRVVGGMHCWLETLPDEQPACGCQSRIDSLNHLGTAFAIWLRSARTHLFTLANPGSRERR